METMPVKTTLYTVLFMFLAATAAQARDPAIGTWVTPPDRKNLTAHIEVEPCGTGLCGRVSRAFDALGRQVSTKNVGKQVFWGMKPAGGGKYDGGTAWVPLLNVNARASMDLRGNTLNVRGCKGVICDGHVWTRLK